MWSDFFQTCASVRQRNVKGLLASGVVQTCYKTRQSNVKGLLADGVLKPMLKDFCRMVESFEGGAIVTSMHLSNIRSITSNIRLSWLCDWVDILPCFLSCPVSPRLIPVGYVVGFPPNRHTEGCHSGCLHSSYSLFPQFSLCSLVLFLFPFSFVVGFPVEIRLG